MKKTALLIAALAAAGMVIPAEAAKSSSVKGYVKKDGTYVAPHRKTGPDSTKLNNYSTKGNYNPYSGKEGTVDAFKPSKANPAGSPYNTGHK